VLHLLLETVQNVRDPLDPEFATEKYRSLIKTLRTELENVRFDVEETDPSMQDEDSSTIARLYQLAALIYLERASTNMMGPESETINRWSDRAFELLDQTKKCNWPFLFLILGAEAYTDERRQRLLHLVSEAEKLPTSRRFESAKRMVEFVWVQDDLGTKAVNYVGKMNTAFSAYMVVPSFL
jgi:hypothetical protein